MHRSVRLPTLAVVTAITATFASTEAAAQTAVSPLPASTTPVASFRVRSTQASGSTGQDFFYNAGPVGVIGSGETTAGGTIISGATFRLTRTGAQYTFDFLSGWTNGIGPDDPFTVNAAGPANVLRFEVQSLGTVGAVSFSDLAFGGSAIGDGTVASDQAGSVAEFYAIPTGDFTVTGTINFAAPVNNGERQRFEINAYNDPSISANVVPEPSTYALLGTGLAGLLAAARRRRTA